jgi:hypothetical protein
MIGRKGVVSHEGRSFQEMKRSASMLPPHAGWLITTREFLSATPAECYNVACHSQAS